MAYTETLPAIVNKMKANSRLIALIAPSRIHEGWIPDTPDIKGIYVTPISGNLKQVLSSSNQTNQVLQGDLRWQVDAFSNESMEDASKLARIACEACLPSIMTAGIFVLSIHPRTVSFDKGYGAYRAIYRLKSGHVEHITG